MSWLWLDMALYKHDITGGEAIPVQPRREVIEIPKLGSTADFRVDRYFVLLQDGMHRGSPALPPWN